jgi:hypothetical protein
LKKWLKEEEGEERENGIFTVASRHYPFHDWEPLFIGNQGRDSPIFKHYS